MICRYIAMSKADPLPHPPAVARPAKWPEAEIVDLLAQSERPMTAYDIIAALTGKGRRVQPPTVYRALERLSANGSVHRIDSLRAFVRCDRPDDEHASAFLVCDDCDRAFEIESPEANRVLTTAAESVGFAVNVVSHELHGRCSDCSTGAVETPSA